MKKDRLDGADWHFRSDAPLAFGCGSCFLKEICGGLRVRGPAFDCQRFCCHKKDCESVCFNAPNHYSKRLAEIKGFDLKNIPRCDPVRFEPMRGFALLIHHASSRIGFFRSKYVALSLYSLLDRTGFPKFDTLQDVAQNFLFDSSAKVIISGMHHDHVIEKIWSSPHRSVVADFLRKIGVVMFTPPNFSVYNNVPHTENLYNIKRIGWLASEFLAAGVPTAMQINACKDRDYERYLEYLIERPEYTAISCDFITGPGYPSRTPWHVAKLLELRAKLQRPLQLIVRGGTRAASVLASVYPEIVVIDSDPLHRALHRQRMIFGNDGRMSYAPNHLPVGAPIDDLLAANAAAAEFEVERAFRHLAEGVIRRRPRKKLGTARNRRHEPRHPDLLTYSSGAEARAYAVDGKSVVSATKSQRATEVHEPAEERPKSSSMS